MSRQYNRNRYTECKADAVSTASLDRLHCQRTIENSVTGKISSTREKSKITKNLLLFNGSTSREQSDVTHSPYKFEQRKLLKLNDDLITKKG